VDGCVFCDILSGAQVASTVYEDDTCVAFLDIRPINPGHVLVIPRRHAAGLADLDDRSGAAIFAVGRQIALALRGGALVGNGVRCEGASLFLSDGAAAGQVVDHVHLHVMPRFFGDGSGFRRGTSGMRATGRRELDTLAAALRREIEDGPEA